MTLTDWLQSANILATVIAVIAAPIVALWVGERLKRRSDARAAKVALFSTLIGLRHDMFASENFRALNLIDAVFTDDFEVREAWSRYYAVLNDAQYNNPPGWAARDEKRRELLLTMARSLHWEKKISTADILRAYQPQAVGDEVRLRILERLVQTEKLKRAAATLNVDVSSLFPPTPPQAPAQPMTQPALGDLNGATPPNS